MANVLYISKFKVHHFCLLFMFIFNRELEVSAATVTKVSAGHLAELPCLSIDDNHRFAFWQLTDDRIIVGPGNIIDENKYNYEVLTGKLFIKGVSSEEAGLYKCYARGVNDASAINVHIIELIVNKAWLDEYNNDYELNLIRALTAIMIIVVSIAIFLFYLTLTKNRSRRFIYLEESRRASPAKRSSKRSVKEGIPTIIEPSSMPSTSLVKSPSGIENYGSDTDFPKDFQQMPSPVITV